jgi:hypothetical protein
MCGRIGVRIVWPSKRGAEAVAVREIVIGGSGTWEDMPYWQCRQGQRGAVVRMLRRYMEAVAPGRTLRDEGCGRRLAPLADVLRACRHCRWDPVGFAWW